MSPLTASQRYQKRKKLLAAGLPIPPELEVRRSSNEKKRADANAASARYRERNRETINEKTRQRRQALAAQIQHLKQSPCDDCRTQFPIVCMDFDHRDGEEKIDSVASMISDSRPLDIILAEIAKCDLVCANCHRIRTAQRGGWDESLTTLTE